MGVGDEHAAVGIHPASPQSRMRTYFHRNREPAEWGDVSLPPMPTSIGPSQKWVDLPMLRPGHLTEGGNTPAERTAITEIRKGDHHDPGHHDRRGRRPIP